MYRCILTSSIAMILSWHCMGQSTESGKPGIPYIELKNTSDSGHCNKLKVLFKPAAPDDVIKISIRENKDGVPGPWYTNKSNPRATDGDYKGLNESIDYDLRINAYNKSDSSFSQILTRRKCK